MSVTQRASPLVFSVRKVQDLPRPSFGTRWSSLPKRSACFASSAMAVEVATSPRSPWEYNLFDRQQLSPTSPIIRGQMLHDYGSFLGGPVTFDLDDGSEMASPARCGEAPGQPSAAPSIERQYSQGACSPALSRAHLAPSAMRRDRAVHSPAGVRLRANPRRHTRCNESIDPFLPPHARSAPRVQPPRSRD